MKLFIVYIAATGEIKRTGVCPNDMISLQPGVGEVVTEGAAVDSDSTVTAASITAVGTITMAGIAVEDETFIIDAQTFTWKTLRSATGEVTIGADAPAAVVNIVAAVTADLITVTAADGAADTVVVTSDHFGVVGNAIDFSELSTNMSMDGAGHLGGTVAGVDVVLATKPLLTTVATWDDTSILSNNLEEATLGPALPNPTTIYMQIIEAEGAGIIESFEVTDGSLVIKSSVVGTYAFKAVAAGYKIYDSTITATANYEIESHNDSVLVTVTAFNYLVPNGSSIEQASQEIMFVHSLISSVTSIIQEVLSPEILHYLIPDNSYAYQDTGAAGVVSFLGLANGDIEQNCNIGEVYLMS